MQRNPTLTRLLLALLQRTSLGRGLCFSSRSRKASKEQKRLELLPKIQASGGSLCNEALRQAEV